MAVRINEAYGCEGEHDETTVAKVLSQIWKKGFKFYPFFNCEGCKWWPGDAEGLLELYL